ncbi:MAG: type II secretion system F family protein [Planctomyces sp.]|jgi:general secretion pathway protein F
MSLFQYTAVNATGGRTTGQLDAVTRSDALKTLMQQSLIPLTLIESQTKRGRRHRVRSSEVSSACSLLSDQLSNGIALLRALRVLEQQCSGSGMKSALNRIIERVADGSTLANALTEHPELFGELDISMVQAGEEGGFLDEALQRLASVRERQEELRGRFLGALAYPALLLVVGTLVVSGMLIFFVPKFEPLFESLRNTGRMPWPTTFLLSASSAMKSWGILIPLVLIGIGVSCRSFIPEDRFLTIRDGMLLKIRGIGPIVRSLAIARFCRVLGTLLQNGVPMLKSLEISQRATGNRILCQTIGDAAENIVAGKSLSVPLAASGHFPPDVLEMISVAEQSNKLESVLLKLADKLEARSHQRIDILMKLLEPMMMVVMAIVVGFLVIALLMPVFEGNGLV